MHLTWKKVSIIVGTFVGVLTLFGLTNKLWDDLGWVTYTQYTTERANYVQRNYFDDHVRTFDRHVARQELLNEMNLDAQNEILAHVKIVPQLKALIRVRCNGDRTLDPTIEEFKRQYENLTGTSYVEPSCDDPTLERQ